MNEKSLTQKNDSGIVAGSVLDANSLDSTVTEAVPVITNRAQVVRDLRELANFLEAHPEVPDPVCTRLNAFVSDRDRLAQVARATTWKKESNDLYFWLSRDFGSTVTFDINIERTAVCRRVVTGQKVVPAQPEQLVDVVEWVCDDAILAPAEGR